jgi:hypothetical protein
VRRLTAAIRAFLETLGGAPYFPEEDADLPATPEQWAALAVLHAEAVHDCHHTDIFRAGLGMVGPRGEAAK